MNNFDDFEIILQKYGAFKIIKDIKFIRYGENYREIIKKKWEMRKLNRKISKNLGIKNKTEKRIKI